MSEIGDTPADEVSGQLQRFAAGEISGADFETWLYASSDAVQAFLDNDPERPNIGWDAGDLGLEMLAANYSDGQMVDYLRRRLTTFFNRQNIEVAQGIPDELRDTILAAQPPWLDVAVSWILESMESPIASMEPAEARAAVRTFLETSFGCVHGPPKWLQAPQWPMVDGKPCTFLGQIDYFHSDAQVYVFAAPNGQVVTVQQSC